METSDDKKQCESEKSTLSDEKEEEGKIYFFSTYVLCANIYKKKIFLTYINCIITTCKKRLFYQLCQLQAKKMNMMKMMMMNLFWMVEE